MKKIIAVIIIVLLAAGIFGFVPRNAAQAAGIDAFQILSVTINPATTCDNGMGGSLVAFSYEFVGVGTPGTTYTSRRTYTHSDGLQDQFGGDTFSEGQVLAPGWVHGFAELNGNTIVTVEALEYPGATATFVVYCNGTWALIGSAGSGINDGRLCLWDYYAVYTTGDAVDVYGIWEKQGYFVLRVTQDELDAAPGADGVNTLIKSSSDGLVQVFRLGTSDVLQVHAGLDFVRFSGLPASDVVCGNIELD